MSIQEIVQANLGHRLFVLDPLIPSDLSVRTMIVSQEVLDAVDAEWPDNWDGLRLSDFRDALDSFTKGEFIAVAENPFRKPNDCFMARVAPVECEVADIRTLVGPGIRAFGCIVDTDCFVALTWDYREGMDFDHECRRCVHEWKQIFGNEAPFSRGRKLHECLTKAIAV